MQTPLPINDAWPLALDAGAAKENTHFHLHIHIVTHARFSRLTIRYSGSTTVWGWEVDIGIMDTIYFMNRYYYYQTKFR